MNFVFYFFAFDLGGLDYYARLEINPDRDT